MDQRLISGPSPAIFLDRLLRRPSSPLAVRTVPLDTHLSKKNLDILGTKSGLRASIW
jgi:hypothetical protein